MIRRQGPTARSCRAKNAFSSAPPPETLFERAPLANALMKPGLAAPHAASSREKCSPSLPRKSLLQDGNYCCQSCSGSEISLKCKIPAEPRLCSRGKCFTVFSFCIRVHTILLFLLLFFFVIRTNFLADFAVFFLCVLY